MSRNYTKLFQYHIFITISINCKTNYRWCHPTMNPFGQLDEPLFETYLCSFSKNYDGV